MCYIVFFIKKTSDSLIPSFLVSNVSELLRSLTKNEGIAHFFAKNEQFAQKTDERIPSPGWNLHCLKSYFFQLAVSKC